MNLDQMKEKLHSSLTPKRYAHSIGTMETAVKLAELNGSDVEAARITGLLHDCARDIRGPAILEACSRYGIPVDELTRKAPDLLHGLLGAALAREFYGITRPDMLHAIQVHTTGCRQMSLLDKIIFIADYVEPGRKFPGVEEIRNTAFSNLDLSLKMALDRTIVYVLEGGGLLHPDTVKARNGLILERSC